MLFVADTSIGFYRISLLLSLGLEWGKVFIGIRMVKAFKWVIYKLLTRFLQLTVSECSN